MARRNASASSSAGAFRNPLASMYKDLEEEVNENALDNVLEEAEELVGEIEAQERCVPKYHYEPPSQIRMKPRGTSALRSTLQKALQLHRRQREKRNAFAEGRFRGIIDDHVPMHGPKVPPILYHCVNEIESRCVENGMYMLSGCAELVRKVKQKFLKGKVPNLKKYETNVLTGVVLSFLNDLDERVIPPHMWEEMVVIGQIENLSVRVGQMRQLVAQLPEANRETMAFLMNHFQTLSRNPNSWMPLSNFARLLGPIFIGYSRPENEEDERFLIIETMYGLLNVHPSAYFTEECAEL